MLSCSEIKRVASFRNILASDSGAYQVKVYDLANKVVTVLVGSGQKGNEDGRGKKLHFCSTARNLHCMGNKREIKLDVTCMTWSYVKQQTAKMTSEFVFFSSNPSLNHIKIEKCLLLFATNTTNFTLVFKELKTLMAKVSLLRFAVSDV